jgi:hypothetical protein
MKNKKSVTFYIIASVLCLFGAIGQILEIKFSPIMFSIGALIIIVLKFLSIENGSTFNKRKQRLDRIGFMSSLLLGLAAFSMFTDSNLWVVALLIYSILSFFLSFRG